MLEARLFAEDLARKGGEILLKGFYSRETVVSYKSRTDLLTNTDKESEAFLVSEIKKRFPDHGIVAEEGSVEESDSDLLWYIDPLDATNNFAHKIPHFCLSIGLYSRSKRRSVAGVVYDPLRRELFSASIGDGAFLNGERIRVSEIDDFGISLLATGFPYDKANFKINNLTQFNAVLPNVQCIRRMGSAALDLCYVASGRVEAFWEPMLKPWDVTAGWIIVEEAGGRVTDYRGGTFDPHRPEIVASNGKIHDVLVDFIVKNSEYFPGDLSEKR